jgi:hypothetical protein
MPFALIKRWRRASVSIPWNAHDLMQNRIPPFGSMRRQGMGLALLQWRPLAAYGNFAQ